MSSPNVARSADTPHPERHNDSQWEELLISHTSWNGIHPWGNATTAREISVPGGCLCLCLCYWWASWLLASPFNSLNFHFASETDEVGVLKYGNLSAVLICSLHFYHLPTFKPQTCSLSKIININKGKNRQGDMHISYLILIPKRRKSHSCWWILGAFFFFLILIIPCPGISSVPLGTLPSVWHLAVLCKGHWIGQLYGKLCVVPESRELYEYILSSLQHFQLHCLNDIVVRYVSNLCY